MLKSLFTLGMIAVFAWYAVGSVYVAMLMYWWFGIFRPHEWMWWDVSSLRLPLLAAFLFIVPAFIKGYYPRSSHPIFVLIICFSLAALLSTISSCVSYQAVTISHVVTIILVILITERLLNSPNTIWGLILVATASLAYLNSTDGYGALIGGTSLLNIDISRGSFSDGNGSALGGAITVFLQLFVIQAIGDGKTGNTPAFLAKKTFRILVKLALYAILIGTVVFIYKSASRGSALSLIIGLVVWTLLQPQKLRILASLGVILAIVIAVGVPQEYSERITSAFADKDDLDDSAKSRPHFWSIAERMAETHPFGVGIGCYKQYYDGYDQSGGYYGRKRSVHSSHYSILAELGYPGYVLWILLLVATYVTLLKVRGKAGKFRLTSNQQDFYFKLSNAMMASMTIFIVGGSFYEMAYNDYTWLMFAITMAMSRTQASSHEIKASSVPPSKLAAA